MSKPTHPERRKPAFLVTIDTECDNSWARMHSVTTRNAAYLSRFQALCERHSELMPAGGPNFPTAASIERLYDTLERLFTLVSASFEGLTLSEYHDRFCQDLAPPGGVWGTAALPARA